MPSAQLTKKIAGQPSPAISKPPSVGPSAVPIADIVPSSPMALPVCAFGTVSPTNAMVSAIMIAAPRPCAARAAISSHSVGATPHSDRGQREQEDTGQEQPPPADEIAEPSDADDQGGAGEQIGQDDPLDLLEGGVERLRQGRQADIGDAGAERGQQHGERQAGERPANRRSAFRTSSDDRISFCND